MTEDQDDQLDRIIAAFKTRPISNCLRLSLLIGCVMIVLSGALMFISASVAAGVAIGARMFL